MIYRLTIFVLSVVVLLLLTERKSVTHVTPKPEPMAKKKSHVMKTDEYPWQELNENLAQDKALYKLGNKDIDFSYE